MEPMLIVAAAAEPSIPVVAATGISLVFLVLVLLIFIIGIQGKIFDKIEARKKAKAEAAAAAALAQAQNGLSATVDELPAAPVKAPPMVEEGIPEEVVAAIVAAIAASSGGKYTLRSLSRAGSGRGKWGTAGAVSSTEPF